MLILDDCLSAVDSLTEAKILENLERRLQGHAVLWTAHRLSTLHLCKDIYRMVEGEIVLLSPADSSLASSLPLQDLQALRTEV